MTSPDGHFLMQANGQPFFWLADTAWEIFHRLNREEVECYLEDRASKGFTVVQAVATGKLDHRAHRTPNWLGETPFLDGDLGNPNPAYFDHVEWVIARAAQFGLRMALLPLWAAHHLLPYGGGKALFDRELAEAYARWLSNRLRGLGVIWVLGGDIMPVWSCADFSVSQTDEGKYPQLIDYRAIFDIMAQAIITENSEPVLVTYHPTSGSQAGAALPRTSLYFGDRHWLSLNMLQTGHFEAAGGDEQGGGRGTDLGSIWKQFAFVWNPTYNYLPIEAEYHAHPTRPVVDAEPSYEAHPILGPEGEARGFWSPRDIRGGLYRALLAGAAGHSYGHFSIWDYHDPEKPSTSAGTYDQFFAAYTRCSWRQALSAPGADQLRHAKALFLSRPYFSRVPDPDLLLGSQGEGRDHIGAARDRAGRYLLAYVPTKRPITLDLTKLRGSAARVWHFDPCTGDARLHAEDVSTSGKRTFLPPSESSDADWVLVIDDAEEPFHAPGSLIG